MIEDLLNKKTNLEQKMYLTILKYKIHISTLKHARLETIHGAPNELFSGLRT